MPLELSPSVIYRIQNVLHPTLFLSVGGDNTVVCAADDVTDTKQQWRFTINRRRSQNGYYTIQTIYNQYYLTCQLPNALIAHHTESMIWYVCSAWPAPNAFQLLVGSGSETSKFVICYGKTNVLLGKHTEVAAEAYRWILRPVTPTSAPAPARPMLNVSRNPLPTGNYRIRSYNSTYLLTMSDDAKSYWSVTYDASTQLYTIQNARMNHFLAINQPSSRLDGSFVVGQAGPYPWVIQAIDKGFMFIIGLAEPQLVLGFSDPEVEDHDGVRLKPNANSPSQIWFFETVQQTGKDEVPAARLLAEGQFAIRNCHDNNYLAILNHRLVAGLPARRLATTLTLRYIDKNSPIFTLRDGEGPWLVDFGGFLMAHSSARDQDKQWIALPHQSATGVVYYICHPAQEQPLSTLSGRQVDNEYVFDERVEGEVMQLWDFESSN